jgi:hypothetical protein
MQSQTRIADHIEDQSAAVAAAVIERKVAEFASNAGTRLSECYWTSGKTLSCSGLHRMNIRIGGKTAQVYFTCHEVDAYSNGQGSQATDVRLERVIEELCRSAIPFSDLLAPDRTPQACPDI